eukprot:1159660-Pelagomonas_calceolata.AAC.5
MQAQWTTPTKPEIRLLLPVIGVAHFEARTGAWGSVSNGSAALPPLSSFCKTELNCELISQKSSPWPHAKGKGEGGGR